MVSRAWRETLGFVLVFALLVGGLSLYAGTWPPAVIVESGSMMHADIEVGFGRVGTIDPGDLVLVKTASSVDDITTLLEGGRSRYGKAGDVIVYHPAGDLRRTPIIHRAVAYVEVRGSGPSTTYDVRWSDERACEPDSTKVQHDGHSWCRFGADGVLIRSVPIWGAGSNAARATPFRPAATGFITKGDNPVTNRDTDQLAQIAVDARGNPVPVPFGWIEGKGRGELPWLGLVKLALAGKPNEDNPPSTWIKVGSAYAPRDLWVMLALTLIVFVGGPIAYDGWQAARRRRKGI